MSPSTKLLCILSGGILAGAMLLTVFATNTHYTAGTAGSHSAPSHSLNPGHVWAAVFGDHTGPVTSGGRLHDLCHFLDVGLTLDRCKSASAAWGGDSSVDIGGTGTSYLSADYRGYAAGGTLVPTGSTNLDVVAVLVQEGNFRNDPVGRPACDWQKWKISITYWAAGQTQTTTAQVGYVWFAHLTNWNYDVGESILANASRPNTSGTGTVYYINQMTIGSVYVGADVGDDKCSSGSHSHVELYSNHSWGYTHEWHSASGPDYFFDYHVHGSNGVYSGYYSAFGTGGQYGQSSMTPSRLIGAVGGGTTSAAIWDNPYYAGY